MNSLNESNCCLTRPFSSKNELMTTQASSCARVEPLSRQSPRSRPVRDLPTLASSTPRVPRRDHRHASSTTPSRIPPRSRGVDSLAFAPLIVANVPRRVVPAIASPSSSSTHLADLLLLFLLARLARGDVFIVVHAHVVRSTSARGGDGPRARLTSSGGGIFSSARRRPDLTVQDSTESPFWPRWTRGMNACMHE